MPNVARCSCGRVLYPGEDWIGYTVVCPQCGEPVEIPRPVSTTWLAWVCLALGVISLASWSVGFSDLPNRMMPRTISRLVQEQRTEPWFLWAAGLALVALAAAFLGREAKSFVRTFGVAFALATMGLFFIQAFSMVSAASSAAQRSQCINNLKEIWLAMANYESTYGAFPPRVSRDAEGRPLLSWRVALLPYMENNELYERFHLDEPWDSPHNRPLADQIPYVYVCPGQAEWCRKLTLYQALDGPGVFFDPVNPTKVSDITDGLGVTLAVVESPNPVPWSSPEDLPFRTDKPFPPWQGTHPGGFNASFVDGSVRFHKASMPETELKAMATRAGGEK